MYYSEAGRIASKFWKEIPVHFPHVKLGAYVIMPDHVHGVINIGHMKNIIQENKKGDSSITGKFNSAIASRISPKKGSLPVIIRSYKAAVTKEVRIYIPEFEWLERYYDHIICLSNPIELERISKYIKENPENWSKKYR